MTCLWLVAGCGFNNICAQQSSQEAVRTTEWTAEFQAGRYKIHADFQLEMPQALVEQLELLEKDVAALLGFQPARATRVHLVLFGTEREYRRYMQTYFPALPQRRALFIQYGGPGMLFGFWHADVISDLRHEVTHALLNDAGQPLPLWLDEGLAEYFEPPPAQQLSGNPYLSQIAAVRPAPPILSIRQLQEIKDLSDFTESHYRDSWAWVHFLIHRRPETRQLLTDYLRARQQGQASADLCTVVEQLVPDLQTEFRSHFAAAAR